MSKVNRLGLIGAVVVMVVGAIDLQSAVAQRRSFGGNNQGGGFNRKQDGNRRNSRDRDDNDSPFGDPNAQQFQQFYQGGQGNPNQYRRSGQQGQFPTGQPLQGRQQFQGGRWQSGDGNWQSQPWQDSPNINDWTQQYHGGPQPFTPQWYMDHPKAWQYTHPHADTWVMATTAGLYAWLGWGNYQGGGTTVVYEGVPIEVQPDEAFDPTAFGDWYPLGVYSILTGPNDQGTRIVQLAVDRHGHVAGTYYDVITNTTHDLSGRIEQKSRRVDWALKSNEAISFSAPLENLTQPYATVTVRLPGGDQQWQLVRMENSGN